MANLEYDKIRKNVSAFFISTIAMTIGTGFLSDGYIQSYMLEMGMDEMSIGLYGTFSMLAGLAGYYFFNCFHPRGSRSYLGVIFFSGLLVCALPVLLITNAVLKVALLLYVGCSLFQFARAIESSCEYCLAPLLFPRETYGDASAKCGMFGSAFALAISTICSVALTGFTITRRYSVTFLIALICQLCAVMARKRYMLLERNLDNAGTNVSDCFRLPLQQKIRLLLPHMLRGVATACFYYFVAVSVRKVSLSDFGQTAIVMTGVLGTMCGCFLFMRLQRHKQTGSIILWSNIICAMSAIMCCFIRTEIEFFLLYIIYMTTLAITCYAVPVGVLYSTEISQMPFVSSMRMFIMNGTSCLLMAPVAKLLSVYPAWITMVLGSVAYLLSGVIFCMQYTDIFKKKEA